MKINPRKTLLFVLALAGSSALAQGCARQPILDTGLNQGQRVVTLTTSLDDDQQEKFDIKFSPINRGGTPTFEFDYKAEDPERGYILNTDGFGNKLYIVREGGDDHRIVLGDQSLMTAEFKFEYELNTETSANQFANFISVLPLEVFRQINGAQLWQVTDPDTAFNAACGDELSIAIRRTLAGYSDYPAVQEAWSTETQASGVSIMDQELLDQVNGYLAGSTNCPYQLTSSTLSNINIDESTRAFLQGQAQIEQRTESLKAQVEQYKELLKDAGIENEEIVRGLILQGSAQETHIHVD